MADTNKTPVMTTAMNTPKAPVSNVVITDDQIVAKPLGSPDFLNLRPVNPNVSFRWVNRSVGQKESTLRFDQALAQGFIPATDKDVKGCPEAFRRNGGQQIVNGDLILMKIDRASYLGAKKYNREKAAKLVSRHSTAQRGKKIVHESLQEVGAPQDVRSKISAFVPSEQELGTLIGDTKD